MNASQIRQQLDDWNAPGATLPTETEVEELQQTWDAIKPRIPESYWPIIYDRFSLVRSKKKLQLTTMANPLTYYTQTPAIDGLCSKYGSYWQGLTNVERLNIASAIAQSVLHAEMDVINALTHQGSISYLATCDGFRFEDHDEVVRLLNQLDTELDSHQAIHLLEGLYSTMTL
ncbi:hypothetical protein N836_35115 [Leptolyngbya sp. Heron Island J]|uniref:hypothetical protein n=1 Tax=Leptolyngbya sp. Heron Island J TaxID=1385935 RepID=UPI0003B9CBB1|nr:hypothetical protein [Leptolyngbya sp. Heron Island J]ESA37852.1 hypothetical protein N836_35115 [Leptolyngbya sp. Heron Island J]